MAIRQTGWPKPSLNTTAAVALSVTTRGGGDITMAKKTRKISVKKNSNYLGTLLG